MKSITAVVAVPLIALLLRAHSLGQELPTATPAEVGVSSEKVAELSTFMQSLVNDGKIAGGVTMMARHGKVVHLEAVGMADREAGTPMKTDAIFRIASMTKPITSVAIMMLWEQGKLGLDDPVSKYIPEFKNPVVLVTVEPLETTPAKQEITIRHLLTHTSGLGYEFTPDLGDIYKKHGIVCGCLTASVTLEENMKKLAGLPLHFHPGERCGYGMSTDVLGRVIEVVSGATLDRFFEERIFTPLGMKDTFFKVPHGKLPRLASAYVPEEGGIRKIMDGEIVEHGQDFISADYPCRDSHRYLSGGGDLCSTAADYFRFCQMLLNGGELNDVRLLKDDSVTMMTANQLSELPGNARFGFGFGIMPETDDIHVQLRGSVSWGGYWLTSFRISPRGDWILITMSQLAPDLTGPRPWGAEYERRAAEAIEK